MCIQTTFSYSCPADRHVKQCHALANVGYNCLFSRMIFLSLDIDTEVGYWDMLQLTLGSLGTPILFFHCSYINLHSHNKYDFVFLFLFTRNLYYLWVVFSIIT